MKRKSRYHCLNGKNFFVKCENFAEVSILAQYFSHKATLLKYEDGYAYFSITF